MPRAAIIRFFNENFARTNYNIPRWSGTMPAAMCHLLADPAIDDNDFVLCPYYPDRTDAQLGVTGTAYHNEIPNAVAFRELQEEIGLSVPNIARFYIGRTVENNNKMFAAYLIDFQHTQPVLPGLAYVRGTPYKKGKIAALVYIRNTPAQIAAARAYLNSNPFNRRPDPDGITGVAMIRVGDARNFYRHERYGKCREFYFPFQK